MEIGQANRRRSSESLDDVPHRPRLPSYPPIGPTHRLPDLYGSVSALLGRRVAATSGRGARARGRPFFTCAGPERFLISEPCRGNQRPRAIRFSWGRSSVGRALQWHCRGLGFDSPRLHHPVSGVLPSLAKPSITRVISAGLAIFRVQSFALDRIRTDRTRDVGSIDPDPV